MNIVLDTSAVVRVILDRDVVFINMLLVADKVFIPHLFFAETGNVFLKYHLYQNMYQGDCKLYLAQCRQLTTDVIDEYTIADEVFDMAKEHQLSYYDAIYLTMADKLGAKLLTVDKRLYATAVKLGVAAT